MVIFLTSSHTIGWAGPLNPANGFVEALREELPYPLHCAMVSSYPDDEEITDRMAWEIRECFENAEMPFEHFEVLDRRTEKYARRIIRDANLVFLCGGHVPTENTFFHDLQLRQLLHSWDGVIIGVSAGSMNCAGVVYGPPEYDSEAKDPHYQIYYQGLGLTKINILPHWQQLKTMRVGGRRLVRDIIAEQSYDTTVYALPDGSFFMIKDGVTTLHGQCVRIRNGSQRTVCREGEVKRVKL